MKYPENHTMKLVKIGFKNFRPFKNWQYFYPERLNLIIGPNNSGKSTFFEILTLLRGESFPQVLEFAKNGVAYRENKIINYAHVKDKPFELSFTYNYNFSKSLFEEERKMDQFCLTSKVEIRLRYDPSETHLNTPNEIRILDLKSHKVIFEAILNHKRSFKIGWHYYYQRYLDLLALGQFSLHYERTLKRKYSYLNHALKSPIITKSLGELQPNEIVFQFLKSIATTHYNNRFAGFNLQNLFAHAYQVLPKKPYSFEYTLHNKEFISQSHIEDHFSHLFETREDYEDHVSLDGIVDFTNFYLFNIWILINNLNSSLPELWDLSVSRLDQKRAYTSEDMDKLGLIAKRALEEKSNLENYSKWFKIFNIAEDLRIKEIYKGVYVFEFLRNHEYVSIHNLGIGNVQLMWLLLSIEHEMDCIIYADSFFDPLGLRDPSWFVISNKLFLLQNPEADLHPKFQSLLADLFADVVRHDGAWTLSLIVETHSEYLVRKLQYLVAKGEVEANKVSIHYFEEISPNSRSGSFRRIKIRSDGTLKNDFGEGFYDESSRWAEELLKIQNSKK
jgi:hypothetical protein